MKVYKVHITKEETIAMLITHLVFIAILTLGFFIDEPSIFCIILIVSSAIYLAITKHYFAETFCLNISAMMFLVSVVIGVFDSFILQVVLCIISIILVLASIAYTVYARLYTKSLDAQKEQG